MQAFTITPASATLACDFSGPLITSFSFFSRLLHLANLSTGGCNPSGGSNRSIVEQSPAFGSWAVRQIGKSKQTLAKKQGHLFD
ncbi:MAG: hypothetical protein Aurels2KO_20380 [Aureliella sp.]